MGMDSHDTHKRPQESPVPKASSSENAGSNLDAFFKRLGQGQGSRLWTGQSGRGTAAVPGSLRTRYHIRDANGDNSMVEPLSSRGARAKEQEPGLSGASGEHSSSPTKVHGNTPEAEGARRRASTEDEVRRGPTLGRSSSKSSCSTAPSSRPFASPGPAGAAETSPFRIDTDAANGSSSSLTGNLSSTDAGASASPRASSQLPPPPTLGFEGISASASTTSADKRLHQRTPSPSAPPPQLLHRPSYRDKRFEEVLYEEVVKLDQLRQLSWNGVPTVHRAAVWQLLVGYMPANRGRREAALGRKRREYREALPQYFNVPDAARSHQEQNILRQILVDVPRTCPDVPFFHQDKVQRAMERILYIWAIRHPASGYVQGINDLATPLYMVFLSAYVGAAVESTDLSKVEEAVLDEVEADVYWCLTKLLDNIQDHYTAMQPGLQRMVLRLEELVQRIDADLHRHITDEGMLYIQFAFRWMNCLLMRELPLRAVVRAWDTYLAEENGFESFHVYVSAALLCHFSSTLREMDFQSMVMFLQDMPTKEWGEEEVEPLLSQAYILSTLFENSPNHLSVT